MLPFSSNSASNLTLFVTAPIGISSLTSYLTVYTKVENPLNLSFLQPFGCDAFVCFTYDEI